MSYVSMTDNNVRSQPGDTPNKRRLSLRIAGDHSSTSDKKPKYEPLSQGTKSRGTSDYNSEVEPPETATSSRFAHHSTSSYSSPSSSADGDHRDRSERGRYRNRHDATQESTAAGHRRRPSYPPTWVTADDRQNTAQSGSSSRSSGRPQNHHQTPSASAAASRHSSPPPSFNLSSGQPLVNPPPKTQAAFVGKLYSMLEDDEIVKTGLIYWSAEGTTFTCPNPTEFSKTVLPRFFKHSNWQSFVRQLNMYSFNKVNDIYSTSTDPQAWEFRHSLFRRGEPHLLASIKRKSSRPSTHEGAQPLSPTEEVPDVPKPMAGWMREAGQPPYRLTSPPQAQRVVYPYPGQGEEARPTSRAGLWESRQPGPPFTSQQRIPPPEHQAQVQAQAQAQQVPRFHPDPNRPPLSAQRFLPPGYPESPYFPQPSPVDALSGQVVALEDRLQKLAEVLNNDRIEHVRNNIDFTSYLLQMVGWAAGEQSSPEMKALQDTLSRSNADMRQKYEALMASDALAIMASGAVNSRDRERDSVVEREDRRSRMPFEPPPPHPRSIHALPVPNIANSVAPRGQSPRTSPLTRGFGELPTLSRRISGPSFPPGPEPYNAASYPHLPMPLNLSRSSNPNVSYFQPPPPLTPTPAGIQNVGGNENGNGNGKGYVNGNPNANPSLGPAPNEIREHERRTDHVREDRHSIAVQEEIARKENSQEASAPVPDDVRPKAGLRNLLN